MDYSQVAAEFRKFRAQYDAGALSEADFKARLQDLMLQDEQGRWWMIGYETGQWYVHDGVQWVRGEPPTPQKKLAAEPAPAGIPVPAAGRPRPRWLWPAIGVGGIALLVVLIAQFWPPKPPAAVPMPTNQALLPTQQPSSALSITTRSPQTVVATAAPATATATVTPVPLTETPTATPSPNVPPPTATPTIVPPTPKPTLTPTKAPSATPPSHASGVTVTGSVRWVDTPIAGARIELKELGGSYSQPALATTLTDVSGRFRLENAPVGSYEIYAISPSDEYWTWTGRSLTVPANGSVDAGTFYFKKKMQLLEPANGSTVSTTTPTLRWQAFPDAFKYHVDVFNDLTGEAVIRADTTNTFIVTSPLATGVRYQWSVEDATNAAGQELAYYSSWTFTVQP